MSAKDASLLSRKTISFDDNRLVADLLGEYDANLAMIEDRLEVEIVARGNVLTLQGPQAACELGAEILQGLYQRLDRGEEIASGDIDGAIRHAYADIEPQRADIDPQRNGGRADKTPDPAAAQGGLSGHNAGNGHNNNDNSDTSSQDTQGSKKPAGSRKGRSAMNDISSSSPLSQKDKKSESGSGPAQIKTRKRVITARTPAQGDYLRFLADFDLVFASGPAGTGKTYLAVAHAAACLERGEAERIILSRPAVEAGERLGFLPGDMRDKVDPYLRPLYDALYDVLPPEKVERGLETGVIEIAPLAFMRGRTLSNAMVILDEAQNCSPMQMKMFLTRLGEGSQMIITGDPTQIDLPAGQKSGLMHAVHLLRGIEGVAHIPFANEDVVRRALVGRIVAAYDAAEPKTDQPGADKTLK